VTQEEMIQERDEAALRLAELVFATLPYEVEEAARFNSLMTSLKDIYRGLLKHGSSDGRSVPYSVRLVLYRADSMDLEDASPWVHDLVGMDAVWDMVENMSTFVAQEMLGVAACPTELTAAELASKTNSVRVSMSRKKNGVAAHRVNFAVMTGGARMTKDAQGRPVSWQMHLDIGKTEAARVLERLEIENGSPLVRT